MKIRGTCGRCGRDFVGEQVVASGGACPWCGEPLNPDYAMTLVDALRDADQAGTALERALTALADVAPAMTLAEASVTGEIRRQVARVGSTAVPQP